MTPVQSNQAFVALFHQLSRRGRKRLTELLLASAAKGRTSFERGGLLLDEDDLENLLVGEAPYVPKGVQLLVDFRRIFDSRMALRLRAARLAANFPNVEAAAACLEIRGPTYRAAESGARSMTAGIIEKAAAAFKVSIDFLLLDVDVIARDRLAKVTVGHIQALEGRKWSMATAVGRRLQEARREAGIRSADEASSRFGWKIATLRNHEAGIRAPSIDRLITYALKLNIDPTRLAFGSTERSEDEVNLGKRNSTAPIEPMAGNSDQNLPINPRWPWQSGTISGSGALFLPVLREDIAGTLHLEKEPLTLPALDGYDLDAVRDLFAVLPARRRGGRGTSYLILKRQHGTSGEFVVVASDGRKILRDVDPTSRLVHGDPLAMKGSWGAPIMLGRQIGQIAIRWSFDG